MLTPNPAAQAFLSAAASIDHTTRLNVVLPETAHRLVPHVAPREAMIALLDIRAALDWAGRYEQIRDLVGLRQCAPMIPAPRSGEDLDHWTDHQAEAWRELAWAIAINTVYEEQAAASVTR